MIKTKVIKGFDCVKMKNDLQARILKETRGMTAEQEMRYFRSRAEAFWQGKAKRRSKAA
jgi:hypothetical protein